jgi:hypothetical protein
MEVSEELTPAMDAHKATTATAGGEIMSCHWHVALLGALKLASVVTLFTTQGVNNSKQTLRWENSHLENLNRPFVWLR